MSKIKKSSECYMGNHLFIVSNWQFTPTYQKANAWTCQRCLITVEGKKDIDTLRGQIHETGNSETEA